MKGQCHLFTDGSVNTQSKVGYGAYLLLDEIPSTAVLLKDKVNTKRFEATSSTRLELQTLLWALNEWVALRDVQKIELTIYTDSQNIISLPARRERLERENYFSRNKKRLKNYDVYQTFYILMDSTKCKLVKVKGHQSFIQQDVIAKQFSLVDQAARQALRADSKK
ncbi:MAG: ribonuclease HI [Flavobacterium sp.]|jgi:ribonuclease HI